MSDLPKEWTLGRQVLFWALVLAAVILPRFLLQRAVPVYLFTDDSHSYLLSAFNWAEGGDWETSPRRGAVYSLFIGLALRLFQNLNAVVWMQHVAGSVAVCVAIGYFRSFVPAQWFVPGLLVSLAYAVLGYPVYVEHMIRSETLLWLFSTLALAAWGWFLRSKRGWLLVLAGYGFGTATLVKNLMLPFPVVVLACLIMDQREAWSLRGRRVALFLLGIALPYIVNEGINRVSGHSPEAAPQSGILLYGRVAQWTVLDTGKHLEVKQLIRPDIEAYRQLPRLNNNIILKRTAVPHIKAWLEARGGTRADLDRLCRDLAFEAIFADFPRYLGQVWNDCVRLHWGMKFVLDEPHEEDLEDARVSTTKMKHESPMLRRQETLDKLADPAGGQALRPYRTAASKAWLFNWHPVLLTSLLLPVVLLFDPVRSRRPFWLATAAVWYFNVLIICTVGRPMQRYLMATLPIIFWTLAASVVFLCMRLASLWNKRQPRSSSP
ncbi:MAG TPA: hypothetical protein VIT21_09820 [Chthoniobacterales bacterium]